MSRLCLVIALAAFVSGLSGCTKTYPPPKPTQPVMPASVNWGTDAQQEQESE